MSNDTAGLIAVLLFIVGLVLACALLFVPGFGPAPHQPAQAPTAVDRPR